MLKSPQRLLKYAKILEQLIRNILCRKSKINNNRNRKMKRYIVEKIPLSLLAL